MKSSKPNIHSKVHKIPEIRFEDQKLTSYSGVVVFQAFFQRIDLKGRLRRCFGHLHRSYGHHVIVLVLIVHLMLGNRRIRDLDYYRDDPMVKRLLGLRRLPDVSTISRTLATADPKSYQRMKSLNRGAVIERLVTEQLSRVTIDFDGSVIWTRGHAEGTAVGFNKTKKGARSYYPLLSTVAQTGQVLDWLDRPGNVHDSRGARDFMDGCFEGIRQGGLERAALESRVDSAFFSDEIINMMDGQGVEFTASVPFERFVELKSLIESRRRWRKMDATWAFFEGDWKPKCWDRKYRFIFVRQRHKKIRKEPIQLDLFEPMDHAYAYKVIVTNKTCSAKKALKFHNGRGSQEGIFGECKSNVAMDYIPFKRLLPNRIFLASSILAHNLGQEIQMEIKPRVRGTTEKRAALWVFESLGTICRRLLQRAGRLTNVSGRLVLRMSANQKVRKELLHYLHRIAA